MNKKAKLVVVDDHEIIREGLSKIFSDNEKVIMTGIFKDGESVLKSLEHEIPDIILMDVSLEKENGIELSKIILQKYPDICIIMLSIHLSKNYVFESLKIGARGYFTKNSDAINLVRAVEEVMLDEEFHLSDDVKNMISDEFMASIRMQESYLSGIERKIVELLCNGKSNKEIADELCLSPKTISNYKYDIMKKLDSKNDMELVKIALRERIISSE